MVTLTEFLLKLAQKPEGLLNTLVARLLNDPPTKLLRLAILLEYDNP